MGKQRILAICDKISVWWKDAQYRTVSVGDGDEDNCFDEEEDDMFDELRKAAEELQDKT